MTSGPDGLTAGQIAGIAVGAVLGAALIAGGIGFVASFFSKKNRLVAPAVEMEEQRSRRVAFGSEEDISTVQSGST
ncbi:Hypp1477 [Branchiostoma lanceolatum]|uniref:Hypp1477 protein n=1 Tax=Branchiostoma lanceolatum TaxID=7740 RepID=A0A8K0EL32_BRALA|nr:Hypp1477 [Branchiostoma lanceolatum]